MAEALAAAYVDRSSVSVSTIASRVITDAGLLEAVIGEANDLAEPERWRSLICLQIGLHENGRYADSVRIGTTASKGKTTWRRPTPRTGSPEASAWRATRRER